MHGIELRHLRYFVAVAENRHFGRAAERLLVSQPSLSYSIKQLETRLGVELLARGRRGISLTAPGETLLAYAREALGVVAEGLAETVATAESETEQLRVGYNDGEPLARRPGALRAIGREAGLSVTFRRLAWGTEVELLRSGAVDVLLGRLPLPTRGLRVERISCEARAVCVAADHRLARRRRVAKKDLARESIVMPVGGNREWVEFWRGCPYPDGSTPPAGPRVNDPLETFDVVASGRGICFVPTSMIPQEDAPDLVFLPVIDLEPVELAVVWKGRRKARIQVFVEAARRLTASEMPAS